MILKLGIFLVAVGAVKLCVALVLRPTEPEGKVSLYKILEKQGKRRAFLKKNLRNACKYIKRILAAGKMENARQLWKCLQKSVESLTPLLMKF